MSHVTENEIIRNSYEHFYNEERAKNEYLQEDNDRLRKISRQIAERFKELGADVDEVSSTPAGK